MSRASPRHPPWPYLTIAAILFLIALPVFDYGIGYGTSAVLFSGFLVAPLTVVGFRPIIGWALSLLPLIFLVPIDMPFPQHPLVPFAWLAFQLASQLPVIYAVALSPRRQVAFPLAAITLTAGFIAPYGSEFGYGPATSAAAFWIPAVALAVVLARFRVHHRRTKVRMAEEVEQRQALEERTRIARELHDVVAHHMSVIAVQASTAQYRIDSGLTAEIAEEFQSIGTSAQRSLQELRQVLGVLRGPEIAARPDLNDLPKLIESTRLAGVPARMIMNGAAATPTADLQYTAYRIIQEALSNVIKHAPGAKTTVTVEIRPHDLVIDVINKPASVRRDPPNTPGHGLTGVRERAEAAGGSMLARAVYGGGFQLRAVLPTRQN
ncbi:sensor histidine kinase [Microlunatus speluncae]|uniref:sensor histidine kinase n=1 Tax=Microlunatus speluncae TaxID=2594267 RepID=UPI00126682CE|nr:histidine kinase [Microlunatus speluncae]